MNDREIAEAATPGPARIVRRFLIVIGVAALILAVGAVANEANSSPTHCGLTLGSIMLGIGLVLAAIAKRGGRL